LWGGQQAINSFKNQKQNHAVMSMRSRIESQSIWVTHSVNEIPWHSCWDPNQKGDVKKSFPSLNFIVEINPKYSETSFPKKRKTKLPK